MESPLDYRQDGHIAVLTMNLPEIRNAISSDEMIDALVDACARMNADMSVRAAILTGAGSAFSSGGDVNKMKELVLTERQPVSTRSEYIAGFQRIPLAFDALEVPIIAAVNGPAMGAGCDLACMCDIRIASEKAIFAESFVKLGLIPGDGGAWLLQRVVGSSKAAEMTLTGDRIAADEALACGLVSKVVPGESLLDEARALAQRIAANPPHAVRMAKRLMRAGRDMKLAPLLEMSAISQAIAHTTADHREAVMAFLEKRTPVFTGS